MKNSTILILVAFACFGYGTLMAFFAQAWTPHVIVTGPEDVFGPYIWTWISYGFGVFLIIAALKLRNDERKASQYPPPPPAPARACPKCGQPLIYNEETQQEVCPKCIAEEVVQRELGKLQEDQSKGQAT